MDANVLVAGFLRSGTTRELLLDERLVLWAPEYSLTETEQVLAAPRLRRRLGGLSVSDVRALLTQLTAKVRLVPLADYQQLMPSAKRLAPHTEDELYLALALHLRLPLWSNDIALKDQPAVTVCTTLELLAILQARSR